MRNDEEKVDQKVIILESLESYDLALKINEALSEGWKLQGQIVAVPYGANLSSTRCMQMMSKDI